MPFMAATLGGRLGSGLRIAGFDLGADFFAVFLAVVVFLLGVFLVAIFFSP
jgi:hypothetical protein